MIEVGGAFYGSYETSTLTTSWVNLTSADFIDDADPAGGALQSGLVFVGLVLINADGANAVNMKYCAMAAAAASAGRTISFGATMSDNLHGLQTSTVSIRGSGANTDARVWASFVKP